MKPVTHFTTMKSPIGELLLTSDGVALTGLFPESHNCGPKNTSAWKHTHWWFSGVCDQLNAYFKNRLKHFDVRIATQGTAFQHKVWTALRDIPYGVTRTYGDLARGLGDPKLSHAVGFAAARNPISIIVPCHRVIGAHGALTGYACGIEIKRWLLKHEHATVVDGTTSIQGRRLHKRLPMASIRSLL